MVSDTPSRSQGGNDAGRRKEDPDPMERVIEVSPVGHLLFYDRECVMLNRAARELLDRPDEELLGSSPESIIRHFSAPHQGGGPLSSVPPPGTKAEGPAGHTVRVDHRSLEDGYELMNLEVIEGSEGWTTVQEDSLERLAFNTQALMSFPIAMSISDLEGRVTLVNPSFLSLWGYDAEEEVLGGRIGDFWTRGDPSLAWESIGESGNWFGEVDTVRNDGSPLAVQVSVGRVYDAHDRPMGTMSSFVDVSDRRKMERELAEREERLSTITHNLPRGMAIIMGPDFRFKYAEGELLEDLGLSEDWVIGSHLKEVLPIPAAEMSMTKFQRVLEGERRTFELEWGGLYLLMRAAPLRGSRGRVDRLLVLGIDVSEQKRIQNELREAKDALSWTNRELKQFAYVASHDLQEPLRKINSFTGLLSKRYQGRLDEKADKYIRYIVDASQRMSDLIDDLLSYSRVVNRDKELEEVDLEEILQVTLQDLESNIRECGGRVTHDPLPVVCGERGRLVQVFENLVSNAIKFRGEEPPRVHVTAEEREDDWLLSVSDNGIGMNMEYADRVFTIFQRLHTREDYPGTGIGLSLVSRIVERHGGEIWLDSAPGEGSTFYFTLDGSGQGCEETDRTGGDE